MHEAWLQERPNGCVLLPHAPWNLIQKEVVEVNKLDHFISHSHRMHEVFEGHLHKEKEKGHGEIIWIEIS